jgi:hypothetical protein
MSRPKRSSGYAAQLLAEASRAERKHGRWADAHHGYGVLLEEVDELWDAIKADDLAHARLEAVQVGAMALRFLKESEHWEKRLCQTDSRKPFNASPAKRRSAQI